VAGSILLLGEGDLAEEVRSALTALDARVVRLVRPTQREVEEAFERGGVERAVVISGDDALALRMALMVRDADAEVELLLTYFDQTTGPLLAERIGNCRITSMAEIVAPVLAGPCVDESFAALALSGDGAAVGVREIDGRIEEVPADIATRRRLPTVLGALLKPYDRSAALLLYGSLGLFGVLVLETVSAAIVLDQSLVDAFYGAAKTLVTVEANDKVADGPSWFKTVVSVLLIIALVFEAFFTAGIVNRLIDRRLTGLAGRNAVPREHHVIVVGLGKVGLRLCLLLRDCGVPVVAVDDKEDSEIVGEARRAGLPVVIGRGADPSVLARLSLPDARAVAAVTDDDLQNIAIAMTALSLEPDTRVVLRVGDGRLANETRSLFKLGKVRDVHRVAASLIAAQATGSAAERVLCADDETRLVHPDGTLEKAAIVASPS